MNNWKNLCAFYDYWLERMFSNYILRCETSILIRDVYGGGVKFICVFLIHSNAWLLLELLDFLSQPCQMQYFCINRRANSSFISFMIVLQNSTDIPQCSVVCQNKMIQNQYLAVYIASVCLFGICLSFEWRKSIASH